MPQLPDYTALGGVADANSGRPIASARSMHPGALAAGVEQLGSDLQAAGSNIDAVAQREKRQDNLVGMAKAGADSLKGLQEAHHTITSDNDYATQPKRFEAASNVIIQNAAGAIPDPRMRALWIADEQKSAVARLGVVESQAATGVKQTRSVTLKGNLDSYQNIIADPATDDLTRKQAQENAQSTITAAQNEGVITPDEAQSWTKTYVEGSTALLAQARTKTKDGNKAIMTPPATGAQLPADQQGYRPEGKMSGDQLQVLEGNLKGVKPTADEKAQLDAWHEWQKKQGAPSGAAPAAAPPGTNREQHSMQALQSEGLSNVAAAGMLGNFIAESGNKLNPSAVNPHDGADGSDSIGIGQWNSTRAVALKAFAASRGKPWNDLDTQLAFAAHEIKTDYPTAWAKLQAARTGDEAAAVIVTQYTKPAGSQSGATASHQWARRRDEAIRLAGGQFQPGTAGDQSDQADPFSTAYGNLRRDYPGLSAAQIYALANEAVSAHNSFKVEDRASLEGVVQDAPAAIQTTGGYDGALPTRQQFADAYGAEGQKKYDTFQAAIGVSKTVHDMLTMPAAQIQATVDASRATNSGPGAELDLKKSEAIQSAAASTLKARKEDPATYTQQAFPAVKAAIDAIDGSPEKYAQAFRLMGAAQTQLGIPPDQQALVTKLTAENVVKASKDETQQPEARLAAITKLLTATQDRGQRQAVFDQLVRAGLPPQMEGVVEAAAAGRSGAAQRLFVAANLKAGDLPGTLPNTDKQIESQIQSDVMADGQIGDAIYGLSAGSLDNTQHLANDAPLLKNDVKLYLSQGVDLATATQRAAHDLYGDLQVINEGQVKAAAPLNIDKNMLIDGLALQKASVGEQMSRYGLVNEAKTPEEKQIARFAGMDKERHIQSILDNGTWRSVGGGYGLLDPATGLFVAGADGKPFVVKQEDALAASGAAFAVPPSPSGVVETPAGPARRDGKPAVVPSPTDYRIFQQRREVDQRQRKMGTTPSPIGADIPAAGAQPPSLDFGGPADIPK